MGKRHAVGAYRRGDEPHIIVVGDLRHAETLIRSITEPDRRAWPLAELGLAMTKAGDLTRARELAQEAETLARSSVDPREQVVALMRLATAVDRTGEPDRARELARRYSIQDFAWNGALRFGPVCRGGAVSEGSRGC